MISFLTLLVQTLARLKLAFMAEWMAAGAGIGLNEKRPKIWELYHGCRLPEAGKNAVVYLHDLVAGLHGSNADCPVLSNRCTEHCVRALLQIVRQPERLLCSVALLHTELVLSPVSHFHLYPHAWLVMASCASMTSLKTVMACASELCSRSCASASACCMP